MKIPTILQIKTYPFEIFIIPLLFYLKSKGGCIQMAKLTAWLVTLVGVLLLLPMLGVDIGASLSAWLIALAWLVVGVSKLMRNYGSKRR